MNYNDKGILLPKFITFTGIDEYTDIRRLVEISERYSNQKSRRPYNLVEWGVLFGDISNGIRYPKTWFRSVISALPEPVKKSSHLCGIHSESIINYGYVDDCVKNYDRIQVNARTRDYNFEALNMYSRLGKVPVIVQVRGGFNSELNHLHQLIDASGGRGLEISNFPKIKSGSTCGYAGGIGENNVMDIIEKINNANADENFSNKMMSNYYIDMESSLRDENDKFCLDTCERILDKVYG